MLRIAPTKSGGQSTLKVEDFCLKGSLTSRPARSCLMAVVEVHSIISFSKIIDSEPNQFIIAKLYPQGLRMRNIMLFTFFNFFK